MGGGASNLTTADLQSYQSAISEVMQSIQNETNNFAQQEVKVFQSNSIIVGGEEPINPCADDKAVQTCIEKSRCNTPGNYIPPIYQCNLKRVGAGATSVSLCDAVFGKATEEEYCYGTPDKCSKQLLRKTCDANPPGPYISWINVPCSSNADCTVGTTCDLERSICGVKTEPGYTEDKTCGGNCGTKTVFQIEFIGADGQRTFTLDNIESIPNNVNPCDFIPLSPGGKCYRAYNLDDYYDCVQLQNTGIKIPENCIDNCNKLACSAEKIKLLTPPAPNLIVKGNICLQNKSTSTFNSTQFAEATTTAKLNSAITNQFQNDITKTITQLNKGMNFKQENNSQERTSITQKVRNTISQAISASAQNNLVQSDETRQINTFSLNRGTVTITSSGCTSDDSLNDQCINVESSPGCGLLLTNESISNLSSTQTAKSVVDALLDSNILNDMKNKYTFTASQTNENDILGGLFQLLMGYIGLIVVFAIIALVGAAILAKTSLNFFNSFLDILKNKWFWVAFIIGTILGVGVYLAVEQPWVKPTTTTNPNPSGQAPSPPPLDPSKPGPSEIECVVNNMAGCKCSIFLQKVEGKTTDELCAPIISQLKTSSTSSIEEQCKSLNIQWGNPPFTFDLDYCKTTQGSACSLRTYSSQSGIRAYCQSPAEPTSSAPTK